MHLSPEQQILIGRRVAADCPSPAAAYSLWLLLGFFGAHRFYLGRITSGALMLAAFISGLSLAALGIIFGGTFLDGIFYAPTVGDILRSSQSLRGPALLYSGAGLLICIFGWWAADAFFILKSVGSSREEKRRDIIAFYENY